MNLIVGLLAGWALAATPEYVAVQASFQGPKTQGADAAIVVTLTPKDPDIHVNGNPAPRLKLDPEQVLLIDKQPPAVRPAAFDPAKVKYLDPQVPLRFAVALAPQAPHGAATVRASVTYYYCSKRENWCRKGSTDVSVALTVP